MLDKKIKTKMKTIVLILTVLLVTGCASRKKAGCDAYGDSCPLENSCARLKEQGRR